MQFSKCDFLTVINCFTIIYCFRFFNLKILPVTEVMTSWKTQSRGRPASPFVSHKWSRQETGKCHRRILEWLSLPGSKTQKVVSEVGRGCLQTLSRWPFLSILTDTCARLIKYGGDREVGQGCAKASREHEPQGDQRQHLGSISY